MLPEPSSFRKGLASKLIFYYHSFYFTVYIALGLYVVAATAGLYNLLAPFVGLIPVGDRCRFVSYSSSYVIYDYSSIVVIMHGMTAGSQPTSCQF